MFVPVSVATARGGPADADRMLRDQLAKKLGAQRERSRSSITGDQVLQVQGLELMGKVINQYKKTEDWYPIPLLATQAFLRTSSSSRTRSARLYDYDAS